MALSDPTSWVEVRAKSRKLTEARRWRLWAAVAPLRACVGVADALGLHLMLLACGLVCLSPVVWAEYWVEDTTFRPALEGNTGVGGSHFARPSPGGKLVLVSSYAIVNGVVANGDVTRLNYDGTVDAGFARRRGLVAGVLDDSRIVLIEDFQDANGNTRQRMLLLRADGTPEPGFQAPMIAAVNNSYAATSLPGGRILVYGQITSVNGVPTSGLVVFNGNGSVDGAFQSPSSLQGAQISHARLLDGERLLIAGNFSFQGPNSASWLTRLLPDGNFDAGYSAASANLVGVPLGLYPQLDGTVLVAPSHGGMIRLSASGALEPAFSPTIVGTNPRFGPMQPDGKILYLSYNNGATATEVHRLNPDGSNDGGFPVLSVPRDFGFELTTPILSDDGGYILGPLNGAQKEARIEFSRILPNGTVDSGYAPRFSRHKHADVCLRDDVGRYLIAGSFDFVNNSPTPDPFEIVRLKADGTRDEAFAVQLPAGSNISRLALQPDGRILALGEFTSAGGYEYLRRYFPDGQRDLSFPTDIPRLTSLAVDALGRIYGVETNPTLRLRRYSADGVVDAVYDPGPFSGFISHVVPFADGSAVVVEPGSIALSHQFVRLSPAGIRDQYFPKMLTSSLVAVIGLPGDRLAICTTNTLPPDGARHYLMRLVDKHGAVISSGTTPKYYGDIGGVESQMALAWLLRQFLLQTAPQQGATIWADFSSSGARFTMDCSTSGEYILKYNPGPLSGPPTRYKLSADAPNGYPIAPAILSMSPDSALLRPLDELFGAWTVVAGLLPFEYQWYKNGVAMPGQTDFVLRLPPLTVTDEGSYFVRVSNAHGFADSQSLTLTVDSTHAAARVMVDPVGQVALPGGTVTFSVVATGNPAPKYQWLKNWIGIPGATNATLVLSDVDPSAAGRYAVLVSNTVTNAAGQFGYSIQSGDAELTFTKLTQTIVFDGPASRSFDPVPFALSVLASSGLPVTVTVVSGPATVTGNMLTLSGAGRVVLRAMQGGNASYEAAPSVEWEFTVEENLASWVLGHFTGAERADGTISGGNADPDNDGLTNLLEYALGLEPKTAEANGLPELTVVGGEWVYTYTRPADRADLSYAVEFTTDLAANNWSTAGVTHELVGAGPTETWRGRVPVAGASNAFFRLKIEQN